MGKLDGKKFAILSETGFEEVELTSPRKKLEDEGAEVHIISPNEDGKLKSWKDGNWNMEVEVDKHPKDAKVEDYHGLMVPGGVINPDKLRRDSDAINFAKGFFAAGKPVAAICHAPQFLIETGALDGRRMTSFHSIKTDLKNAGVNWEDSEVVVDQGLVTSRDPDDLDAFNDKMVEEFAEGKHEGQMTV